MSQEDDTKPRRRVDVRMEEIPPNKLGEELDKVSSLAWLPSLEQEAEWEAKAQAAEKQLINGIGDIVQIAVGEIMDSMRDQLMNVAGDDLDRSLRASELGKIIHSVHRHAPMVTERVMNRLKQGEEPYSSRQKSEKSHEK